MSGRRLRFIHSSDWHLERPLGGVQEVPERLRDTFADAPYLAAEKVVDAALAEQADFVVLSGDLLDVELAGPRGVSFLSRQFQRLAARRIAVYWASGQVDRPERWTAAFRLPDNVFRFSNRRPEDFLFSIGEEPVARLTGQSRPRGGKIRAADFWPDPDGLPSIAVVHGRGDGAALADRSLTYWALGGKHARAALHDVAHYPGSPQGRNPDETGAYGCTLVDIDDQGRLQTRPIATDVVRWRRMRATVDEAASGDSLEELLLDQMHELRDAAPDAPLLVSWCINGSGPTIAALRRGLAAELLARLRRLFEPESPITWIGSLEVEPGAAVPPAWSQEDSLLGDFLRSLGQFDGAGDSEPVDLVEPLARLVGGQRESAGLKWLIRLDEADRRRMLQTAAALGADLLRDKEAHP